MERRCTLAEISEKRRLAMEKLQQSKAASKPPEIPKQSKLTAEQRNMMEQNRLRALERLEATAAARKASLEQKQRSEQNRLRAIELQKASAAKKASIAPGKAESALKVVNSNRQHPYLPNQNQKAVVTAPPPKVPVICSFEIVNELQFEARTDKYDETVINSFKKIKTRNFHRPSSTWSFNLSDYENLLTELATIKGHVTPKPIPPLFINFFREPTPVPDKMCLQFIEPTLEESLKDFQREGVCFGISREGRFMLADDPGLGKTRQALAVADYYKADFPLLIVTPAAVRDFWRDQIFELLPSVNIADVATIDSNNKNVGLAKVVIVSYSGIDNNLEKLKEKRFGVVIFDESHRLKERSSKQTVNATILAKRAARVILVSGTPALSRPRELYQQLAIIDERFKDFRLFAERYCEGKFGRFGLEANGACNLNELKALLSKKFMIRRTKDDVFSELGDKERIIVELPEAKGEAAATQMQQFSKDFNGAQSKKQQHELLIQWYTQTAALKADLVCSYIEQFAKSSKEKFLVFGHHRVILDAIQHRLFQLGVSFIRIDGDTKPEQRDQLVQRFQVDSDLSCAILSLKACSVGITLTAASVVIFAELHWTPSDIIQAEGRVHRIGQERQVKCYFLLAPGTADEVMWRMLKYKQRNISKAGLFSNNEQFSTQIAVKKFDPEVSTSTVTPKKTIKDHFEVATTPRKPDEMDTSECFLSCKSSFDDECEMAASEAPKQNDSTQDLEASFMEMPSYHSPSRSLELINSTQDLEAAFMNMPTYHTQLPEANENPESNKVLSDQNKGKQLTQPGRSVDVPKKPLQSAFEDDDDMDLATVLEAEKIAEEKMKKRQERSVIDLDDE